MVWYTYCIAEHVNRLSFYSRINHQFASQLVISVKNKHHGGNDENNHSDIHKRIKKKPVKL